MDSTIIAAVIGGVFTVGASFGTFAITRIADSTAFPRTKNVHQLSLTGFWEGTVHQAQGPEGVPADAPSSLTLTSTHRAIRGESILSWPHRKPQHLSLAGKFVYARFVRLEYEVRNEPEAVQFGYILGELSPDGQSLDGRFLGFGAASRNLVWGTFHYQKQGQRSLSTIS